MRHATPPKVGDYRQILPVFLVLKLAFFYSFIKPIEEQIAMLIGYARVSTIDQNTALQMDALKAAGCGFYGKSIRLASGQAAIAGGTGLPA